ncbi:MAG: hypothetical protein LBM95_06520 [Lactobacillales bacterium]|jgi:predicted nucleotidyltransferase|nr:hypothetical protein [Lactobacillales bacterium]
MALKSTIEKSLNKAKSAVEASAERVYDLTKKNYRVKITVDKNGLKKEITTDRPTAHTIKWRSKGY